MPVLTKRAIQVASQKQEIPAEMIEDYKKHIEAVEKNEEGVLEFGEGEDIKLGRRALVEASFALKQYVSVRKERGADNRLVFRKISKKEFDEAQARIQARVAKLKGKKRGRPKMTEKKKPGRKPGRPAGKRSGRKKK